MADAPAAGHSHRHTERAYVEERIEELLRSHPPADTAPGDFWGAQFDLGLAWVHFPEGYGGLGVHPDLQLTVNDRLREHEAPNNELINFMGVGMAAPTIVAFGTEEQKRRYLRPLFTCEEIWCQMFSEPGAGSDLAALATSAVREGDEWIVNGQKVFTTLAHVARWGLLLARCDPDVPKHRGLVYFIADMEAPGVEVRPLRQLTGEAEFNEVYFSDARLPDRQRIGEPYDGWRVAITTLMNERVALAGLGKAPRDSGPISHALELWRELQQRDSPLAGDPVLRDRLVQRWIEAELMRLTTIRADAQRKQGAEGPEGSIGKLAFSQLQQHIFDLCMDLRGLESLEISDYELHQPTVMSEEIMGDVADRDLTKAFLGTLASTIGGGTTEVARNVIGERVLGLPPEPRVDKELPWREVPRN